VTWTLVGLVLLLLPERPPLSARTPLGLALFYHPPAAATAPLPSGRLGMMVLTRGDEAYRDRLRASGFAGSVLQYLLANETTGPANLRGAAEPCGAYALSGNSVSGPAQDFCSALHGDEFNFLHNGRGERLTWKLSWQDGRATGERSYYLMNPAAPTWRQYFADRAWENLRELGYSGLLLDNLDLTLDRPREQQANSDDNVAEYTSTSAFREAVVGWLGALRRQLGPRATLWANLTGGNDSEQELEPYLPDLNGVMAEAWVGRWRNRYPDERLWNQELRIAERVLDQGKGFLAVAQGELGDRARMRFALASYLLIAQPGAYFRYASADDYGQSWLYDDYQARLGAPTSRRYQRGGLWRRDFACGYVTVDVPNRVGTIATNPGGLPLPGC
jgi:putative glycosyl hydrolase-like family 15 (GHL15) protein